MTKVKAAYDWTSANIRNTTRQMAEEAEAVSADQKEKPESWRTAQDILTAKEGGGRDLDFLFFGIARALGAEAYPVLAADRTDHYFNPDYLSIEQFDWTLVAVKAKGDPDDKLVFTDLGSGLPFGEVPWWLAGGVPCDNGRTPYGLPAFVGPEKEHLRDPRQDVLQPG